MVGLIVISHNDGTAFGVYTLNNVFVSDADAFLTKDVNGNSVGYIAYGRNSGSYYVQLLTFDVRNPLSIREAGILNKDNTNDGYLCPSKVNGQNNGFLAITSVCINTFFSDSRIIVFRFPGPRPYLEYALPNDGRLINPEACYFGNNLLIHGSNPKTNKYVIYTTRGNLEDPTEEHFGLEEYGLTNVKQVYCSEETTLFTVVSTNPNATTKNIGVFYGDGRVQADKRCHSLLTNVNVSKATAFNIGHGLVHVTYDTDGYPFFWFSYANGPLIYTDISSGNTRMIVLEPQSLFYVSEHSSMAPPQGVIQSTGVGAPGDLLT